MAEKLKPQEPNSEALAVQERVDEALLAVDAKELIGKPYYHVAMRARDHLEMLNPIFRERARLAIPERYRADADEAYENHIRVSAQQKTIDERHIGRVKGDLLEDMAMMSLDHMHEKGQENNTDSTMLYVQIPVVIDYFIEQGREELIPTYLEFTKLAPRVAPMHLIINPNRGPEGRFSLMDPEWIYEELLAIEAYPDFKDEIIAFMKLFVPMDVYHHVGMRIKQPELGGAVPLNVIIDKFIELNLSTERIKELLMLPVKHSELFNVIADILCNYQRVDRRFPGGFDAYVEFLLSVRSAKKGMEEHAMRIAQDEEREYMTLCAPMMETIQYGVNKLEDAARPLFYLDSADSFYFVYAFDKLSMESYMPLDEEADDNNIIHHICLMLEKYYHNLLDSEPEKVKELILPLVDRVAQFPVIMSANGDVRTLILKIALFADAKGILDEAMEAAQKIIDHARPNLLELNGVSYEEDARVENALGALQYYVMFTPEYRTLDEEVHAIIHLLMSDGKRFIEFQRGTYDHYPERGNIYYPYVLNYSKNSFGDAYVSGIDWDTDAIDINEKFSEEEIAGLKLLEGDVEIFVTAKKLLHGNVVAEDYEEIKDFLERFSAHEFSPLGKELYQIEFTKGHLDEKWRRLYSELMLKRHEALCKKIMSTGINTGKSQIIQSSMSEQESDVTRTAIAGMSFLMAIGAHRPEGMPNISFPEVPRFVIGEMETEEKGEPFENFVNEYGDMKDQIIENMRRVTPFIEKQIMAARQRSRGLMPVGGKVHVKEAMSGNLVNFLSELFGFGQTSFRLIHAGSSMLLPVSTTAFELQMFLSVLESFGVTDNKNPDLQISVAGRWSPETAPIVGSSMLLATQAGGTYEPNDFVTTHQQTGARIMAYDDGIRREYEWEADLANAKGRTDILGRRIVSDIPLYQVLGTLASHHDYDGPLKGTFADYRGKLHSVLGKHGLRDAIYSAAWIKQHEDGDDPMPHVNMVNRLGEAYLDSAAAFRKTGRISGTPMGDVGRVIAETMVSCRDQAGDVVKALSSQNQKIIAEK